MNRKLLRFKRKLSWFFGVYLRRAHVATIDTRNGLLSFYSKDRMLGRCLYIEGDFEYDGMISCVKLLVDNKHIIEPENGTVMDVGGYVGMSSIGFLNAKLFSEALIFEPNPDSFRLIEKNIKQNNMSGKIRAFNIALSNEESELIMELSHKNYGDNRIRKNGEIKPGHYKEENRKTIKVRATTLDNFEIENSEIQFDNIKLIWMDIQGHEGNFLAGGKSFLSKFRHIPIAMEFWPYGLNRAGISKQIFCQQVKNLYNKFYILDEVEHVSHDISEIDGFFEHYVATPWGGCHLILVNT